MANIQERAELHKTIWKIANDLRGSVDGWEFKAYVLGSIFYRFISENICDYIRSLMAEIGQPDFDYAAMSDNEAENIRQKMVQEKGYFILPSHCYSEPNGDVVFTKNRRTKEDYDENGKPVINEENVVKHLSSDIKNTGSAKGGCLGIIIIGIVLFSLIAFM